MHTSKVKKTNLPTVAIPLSNRGAHPPFNLLNYSHNKVTQKKRKGHPRSTSTPSLNIKNRRKLVSQHNSKGLAAHVPSPSFPFRHSEHSERGEPSDSELLLHASLISCHKRSIDKWQGNSMPPARPPNLLGKERSLHLTNSAQRLQERDY